MDSKNFEQWFLQELEDSARFRFRNGKEHVWHVLTTYLKDNWVGFSGLTDSQLSGFRRALFELGVRTSSMVGIVIPRDVERRLKNWGWSLKEIGDFPGWAFRVAQIRNLIGTGEFRDFGHLLRAAQSHTLSEAERQAIQSARTTAMRNLQPVFDSRGNLVQGDALEKEKERYLEARKRYQLDLSGWDRIKFRWKS